MISQFSRAIRDGIHALDIDILPVALFVVPVVAPVLYLLMQRTMLAFVMF